MHEEIARVLGRPDVREKFHNSGIEVVGSTPLELTATMQSDMARLGKVIKASGIRAE